MGTYLQEELKRKNLENYIPKMESIIAARESSIMPAIDCFKCFYNIFDDCPVNGHKNNAACLQLAKSYFNMSSSELKEQTEKKYKEALMNAAKMYHFRMQFIKRLMEQKGEVAEEE